MENWQPAELAELNETTSLLCDGMWRHKGHNESLAKHTTHEENNENLNPEFYLAMLAKLSHSASLAGQAT